MPVDIGTLQTTMVEGRYRLLVDAITDYAIYMLDTEGHISSWNAGANRFKGYTEQEILGEHFSRFYTPEDREVGKPQKALETAAREGRFEAEGWRVRKDGEQFWAHVIIDAIFDPAGHLLGFAKITRDLSERKRAEEVLRASQEQFRLLVQGVTDYAIYMLDPEGKVSSWNLGAQRIKGYDPEEIIGEHFSKFYTDEDKAENLPRVALQTAAQEGRFEREGWRLRKDGSRFWANVIIDAIRGDGGELIGFAKVTRDITEKRRAQEALEQAQRELFQAQKMEAVGQLTGGIAHDFNNLLMAILGSLEIAKRRAVEGKDVVQLIDNAILGAKRGASLTQRLLSFSRKQDLKLEPVDVQDLVKGMADLLQRTIGGSIEIATTFPLSLPLVVSDPNHLATALLNLVVNARDAMPDGGTITIKGRRRAVKAGEVHDLPGGNYVCLTVADEGEGMDAKTLDQAMTPFFTTKGIGKGTGLGLPMVHGFLAQSGGALNLKSRPGTGTTAELWMPVAAAETVNEAAKPAPEAAPTKTSDTLNVMVVDDDALVLMNTVLMLEDIGHSTVQAQSAEEALKLLEHGDPPDVLITDQAMPHITGAELLAKVAEKYPAVAVILATGYAELPERVRPDVERLAKPFSQGELQQAILRAREHRQDDHP